MRRLAHFIERYPKPIVIAFLVLSVAALSLHLARARFDFTFRAAVSQDVPELAAFEELVDTFGDFERLFLIVFADDDVLTDDNLSMTRSITRRLERLEDTAEIVSLTNVVDIRGVGDRLTVSPLIEKLPRDDAEREDLRTTLLAHPLVAGTLISDDGSAAALVGRMISSATDPYGQYLYFNRIKEILGEEGGDRVEFHIVGNPSTYATLMGHMLHDATVLLPLTTLLLAALLWLTFGRLAVIWQALAPIGIAVAVTYGVLSIFDLPITILTGHGVLAVLIIIIGLSDAIHLINRFDEGRDSGTQPAVEIVLTRVGRACLLTSLTTGIGFLSLVASGVPMVRDFGMYGAFGMLSAFVATIVFIPAAEVLRRKNSLPRRSLGRRATWPDRVTARACRLVTSRPKAVVATGVALLFGFAAMIPWVGVDHRPTVDLKSSDPTVVGIRFVEENLGGALPLEILFRGTHADAIKDPEVLIAMDAVAEGLERHPGVSKVISPVTFIKQMNRAMHGGDERAFVVPATSDAVSQYLLLFEMAGSDSEFERLVDYDYSTARMRALTHDMPTSEFVEVLAALSVLIDDTGDTGVVVTAAGEAPLFHAMSGRAISALVRSLYIAMPVIFVVTGIAFRSARLGLLTILPNMLPLTVGLGFLGLAGISLRFSTVVAFPVAFGIAIDDTIHFLARYREERAKGGDAREAVAAAMSGAGRAMLLTTVFLVIGFSVLFLSEFLAVIHIAAVICVVLVAAVIGDLFLLPALLLVFERKPEPRSGLASDPRS